MGLPLIGHAGDLSEVYHAAIQILTSEKIPHDGYVVGFTCTAIINANVFFEIWRSTTETDRFILIHKSYKSVTVADNIIPLTSEERSLVQAGDVLGVQSESAFMEHVQYTECTEGDTYAYRHMLDIHIDDTMTMDDSDECRRYPLQAHIVSNRKSAKVLYLKSHHQY